MSEVLYNEVYYQSLFDFVGHVMRPGCVVIIGTKTFYYGLGGGFFAVEKFLKDYAFPGTNQTLQCKVLKQLNDLQSIERMVLHLEVTEK